ncbi:hypothetical protein AwWohl_01330 [Gammaproteobacteria bacterium]|nr:hypothetical protein AwWohl_01330 [Gammaproteobacteria bacterium]
MKIKLLYVVTIFALNFAYTQNDPALSLKTTSMTPKVFKSISVDKSALAEKELPVDFCIIGHDDISKKWLKSQTAKDIFIEYSEFDYCIIVNAKSWDEIFAMKKLLPSKVALIPMNANWMTERYGIKHYPGAYSHYETALFQSYP